MPESLDVSTPLAYAHAYARLGWYVFPLQPGKKQPLGRLVPRGMLDASLDEATIAGWWGKAPDAGIGIALAPSGLVAIDVDPRNGGVETFDSLQAEHGSLRSEVMAFTGGGGEHHVFAIPHGHQISLPGTLGPGIDLKANGYIVVEPTHANLEDGHRKAYAWEASSSPLDGVVPSPLPDWLRSLRIDLRPAKAQPAAAPVDQQQMRDAREALYMLDADDHDQWIKAGMALHSTGWEHPAYALWCSWAQQSSKFDATEHRKRWASFHTDGDRSIRLSFIFAEAQRRGWRNPAAKIAEATAEQPAPEGLILTISELHQRAGALRWAVKWLVPERGVGFIFGPSGAFKSFIELDYAMHRAYGMQWMGRKTKQAIPIYLAAEGGSGLMRRIEAWHKAHSMDWRKCPMRVVPVSLTLRTQAATLRRAIEACGIEPGDVIVDTMSQTFTGNENSNDEVADFLRVLGTELRDGLGCTVSIVHHTGHIATERPRGASAITSNADFAFGVFRQEQQMLATIECAKAKEAERFEPQTFEISSHTLGHDDDGDAITSLVATHVNNVESLLAAHQREVQAGRGGREAILLRVAQNGMTEKALRKAFYEELPGLDPDTRKKAFYRSRDAAAAAGFIEIVFDATDKERRVLVLKEVA